MLIQHFRLLCVFLLSGGLLLGQSAKQLDTTSFVVLGEGLAAGVNNFSLDERGQTLSFPALIARQMGTIFPQPVFQSPGIGNVTGFPELQLRLPTSLQTTLRKPFPPQLFVFNVSIPGLRTAEAISRRPVEPLIHQYDAKQTLINMILGYPQIILEDEVPLWTPLEYATRMRPTLALVELGYHEVVEASVKGDLSLLPSVSAFRTDYNQIVSSLRGTHAEVIVTTIPDPFDTAYFNDPFHAASLLKTPPFVVLGLYGLAQDDWITVPGLVEMGNQFLLRASGPLPSGSVVPSSVAAQISAHVTQLNQEIRSIAGQQKALVFDLHGLFQSQKAAGVVINDKTLTADFLGGLYTLNGYYPGPTGHALIANSILELLNQTYHRRFLPVDVATVIQDDSVADFRPSEGQDFTLEEIADFVPAERMRYILRVKSQLENPRPAVRERTGVQRPPIANERERRGNE